LSQINDEKLDADVNEILMHRQLKDLNRSAEYIYDDMVRKFAYSRIIEVDPDNGPISTLEMALDFAEENSIIRLAAGVYSCNKPNTMPGITVEQKDKEGQVIIIGNQKAVIDVRLQKG